MVCLQIFTSLLPLVVLACEALIDALTFLDAGFPNVISSYGVEGFTKGAIYRQFPDNPAAQERVGALLLKAGRVDDAVSNLEAAVSQSPTPANRAALATAYLKNKLH